MASTDPGLGNGARFRFLVAADLQWGANPAVAIPALKFISLVNAVAASAEAPEFLLLAGDVVDCEFGSAGSVKSKIFGDAADYARDYVQAWLVLAALRLPVYIVPGNHDGYRFEDISGNTSSDGLLLFESTLGPNSTPSTGRLIALCSPTATILRRGQGRADAVPLPALSKPFPTN